jgi:uncharacterized protein
MTTAHVGADNVALVKRGYEAFGSGDMTTLMGLYHPDAAFYTVPHDAADGNYRGRDAIFAFLGELFRESEGTFKATPVAMAAAGDRVFVLQELSGKRNARSLQENTVMVFTIDNGLVREMREFITPQSGIEAFWAT